jgi:hypothetical protein
MPEWNLDDPRWRDRVGDDAELAYRHAMRLVVDLRDRETYDDKLTGRRVVFLTSVLNRLGELAGYDSSDIWERD